MTVVNEGGAIVRNVAPGTPAVDPAGLAALRPASGRCRPPSTSLAPGASATFTWTFVAGTTPATVRISAAAAGVDDNSGAVVSSATATSGDFIIGAAGIQATLSASPATVNVGQAIALVLTVSNPGQAAVNGSPSPDHRHLDRRRQRHRHRWPHPVTAGRARGRAERHHPLVRRRGGGPGASIGHLTFHVSAGGVDAFSGTSISAAPTAEATVETPASVTATGLAATPATLVADQTFSVTLGLAKTGGSAATVTGHAHGSRPAPRPRPSRSPPRPAATLGR